MTIPDLSVYDDQLLRVDGHLMMTDRENVPDELRGVYDPDIEVHLVTSEGRKKIGHLIDGGIENITWSKTESGGLRFRINHIADLAAVEIVPNWDVLARLEIEDE